MALPTCPNCDCIPPNIENDKFKQDVESLLCQTLTALGYSFAEGACNPCSCIGPNIANDKFKQDVEILLCALLSAVGGDSPLGEWNLLGNSGTVDGTNFLGTIDNVALTLRVNNVQGFKILPPDTGNADTPDIIGGSSANNINADAAGNGNAILSGGGFHANTIEAEAASTFPAQLSVICGGDNNHLIDDSYDSAYACFIGGGERNGITGAEYGVVCGGFRNTIINAFNASIVGGEINSINSQDADYSIIAAGANNQILGGDRSGIFCGHANVLNAGAGGDDSGIFSGTANTITTSASASVICGGNLNQIVGAPKSAILCGDTNTITGDAFTAYNAICGGVANEIITGSSSSMIGAGSENSITGSSSFLSSGLRNEITGDYSFIGNGDTNSITANKSFIGAGIRNEITGGDYSFVGGGDTNVIVGNYSAIPGGRSLKLGTESFGFQVNEIVQTDLSAFSKIAFFGDTDLWVGNVDNTARKLKLFSPNNDFDYSSAHYTSFQAPALAGNIEYIMPNSLPSPGNSLEVDTVVGTVVTLKWA